MKRLTLTLFATLLSSFLCACSISPRSSSSSPSSAVSSREEPSSSLPFSKEGYHKDTKRNDGANIHDINAGIGADALPSTDLVSVLVIPVEFTDFPFTSSRIDDIQTAFSGSANATNYWQSVRSYYYQSSYEQLCFDFVFADTLQMNMTSSAFYNAYKSSGNWAGEAMEKGVAAYKKANGNASTQRFDRDKDGLIDSVMMVYSAPDCSRSQKVAYDTECWWAYCYYDLGLDTSKISYSSPVGYLYFWASYDFLYVGVNEGKGVDAHAFIHETGHLLGTSDYYNYDGSDEPAGLYDMMDMNVIDHDCFTKMLYGWVDPYVVDDSCTISLRPYETSGDCIVLAPSWNGTAWDEYIVIEYYTANEGELNYLDSRVTYEGNLAYQGPGIRMWHIDNRVALATYDYNLGELTFSSWASAEQVKNASKIPSDYYYKPAFSNTPSNVLSGVSAYNEISLISAQKKTFTRNKGATNNDLFQKGSTWSLTKTDPAFAKQGKFDTGDSLDYSLTVEEMNDEYATISFRKTA